MNQVSLSVSPPVVWDKLCTDQKLIPYDAENDRNDSLLALKFISERCEYMVDHSQIISTTIENYEKYINPAVAKLFRFMGLATVEWQADGCIIRDIEGKEYIDCLGGYGVFSLGHRHPKVIAAVKHRLKCDPSFQQSSV